ncbi:transporter [Thiolapillus sp.]
MTFARLLQRAACLIMLIAPWHALFASENAEALAKKLANPLESLISVPFQLNYDGNIGPDEHGKRWTLNIQPVVPFSINEDWNLVSRTILPLIDQHDVVPNAGTQSGIGDITQSFFLAPVKPATNGWQWGAGAVMLLPTGADDFSSEKWGIGPTAAMIKQQGAWTIGGLFNHVWSFAGNNDRPDISATFLQPFITHVSSNAVTTGIQTEATYDWKSNQWSVPILAFMSKIIIIGNQKVSLGGGIRYWATSPDNGPHDWGGKISVTLLLPK